MASPRSDAGTFVDALAVDPDVAAADLLQAGDHAQQRRFAAARRADEHHELAVRDVEVDAVEDRHGAVGLLDVGELEVSHRSTTVYFIPVLAMPVVMKRCRKTKTSATGSQRHDGHREQVVPLRSAARPGRR